jgi:hypothetical protein
MSQMAKTSPWKNNAMTLLMHRLDSQLRSEFGRTDRISEIDNIAEGMVLRLYITSNKYKLLSKT